MSSLYLPPTFTAPDDAAVADVLRDHPFATLVTVDPFTGEPQASHLPLLHRPAAQGAPARLAGHLARPNPQSRHLEAGLPALAVFHGPHAYVSPSWYSSPGPAVPTWNYVAVHVQGRPEVITDAPAVRQHLRELVGRFEDARPAPWQPDLPAEYWDRMMAGIVAFEIVVTSIEGKFKLSQNRPPADARRVAESLADSAFPAERELVPWMQRANRGRS